MKARLVDLQLYQKLQTAKAYGVVEDDADETKVIWLPKSMVERGELIRKTKAGNELYEFTMSESLAIEKELV